MSEAQALERIKADVEGNSVCLFMKGTPDSPQCGFSSTVHGNAIAMEAQAAKLRLIVELADEVWGR